MDTYIYIRMRKLEANIRIKCVQNFNFIQYVYPKINNVVAQLLIAMRISIEWSICASFMLSSSHRR